MLSDASGSLDCMTEYVQPKFFHDIPVFINNDTQTSSTIEVANGMDRAYILVRY